MLDRGVHELNDDSDDLIVGNEDLELVAGLVAVFADPVYVAVSDQRDGFVLAAVNKAFEEHTGISRRELVGHRAEELWTDGRGEAMLGRWRDTTRKGRPVNYTITGVGLSGERTVNVTLSPSHDRRGRSYVVGVARDITESIRASERLATLFAHASEGVAVLNPDLTVTEVLFGNQEIWGCRGQDLVGVKITDLIHPENLDEFNDHWKRAIADPGGTITFEFQSRRIEGQWRWTECVIANLCNHADVRSLAITLRDCHERRLAEAKIASTLKELQLTQAELLHASKLESVGQLAAGIAHEINTPMQYIASNTHFLQATLTRLLAIADAAEEATNDDSTKADHAALAEVMAKSKLEMLRKRAPKALGDVLLGVETVSSVVKAMKRFAQTGSEDPEEVDINGSLTTTVTISRNAWKYTAKLETNLADDLPPIEGWPGPLNQVWLNMIINACHAIADAHGNDKGVITITTAPIADGAAVQVEIGDNGSGIEPNLLTRVFDPFFTTKRVGHGSGQGLAIARQVIVSQHNGSVTVDSVVGEGTTFTVTLPVVQPQNGAKTEAGGGGVTGETGETGETAR